MLLALLPALLAAACTASTDADRADRAGSASAPASPADSAATQEQSPTCESPSKRLLDWAGVSVASHPGPITSSALVFAATTDTGDWYVLALERGYVHDDGSPAEGSSRHLALTNAAGAGTNDPHLIDVGSGSRRGEVVQDWGKVSWSGETLAAGRRAADLAIDCLDHA
jgi:hypothetical protein